ncbi:SusC/RagA family TonB-linked outer membrane protein [Porphyromonadaceae bacterium OttesenSCG-928-L07]|nr:SusC/RagA family TonB-linked outer membrane protein [Porphyromonadaceae bacterium OttesenSCG-928-L07]MDL2330762.1 SusC/RagA family TonB-linked outer membrane protein [Odoribacter sp. OttesenSCG-928-A06]
MRLNIVKIGLLILFLFSGSLFTFQAYANENMTSGPAQEANQTKGLVVDESGIPLPGVTIRLKGVRGIGTVTGNDGAFTLNMPPASGRQVLVFTYIGFETREVDVKPDMGKVTLKEEQATLDEVIVTGYQRIDRKLFTGSASVVKADELESDGANDLARMLQGKAAGVQIQNVSGTFGAAPKMRIRGSSSIFGEQKPLWVVDGIVLEDMVEVTADELSSGDAITLISSSVAGLNSDDIESFQILKDASATAMYGARAMNGVIVITTKKGKNGKMTMNYSGEFAMRQIPSYREFNVMNSQQQMAVYQDLYNKGWLSYASIRNGNNGGIYRKMYDKYSIYNAEEGKFEVENTQAGRDEFLSQYEFVNTNWFKTLFKSSIQQNHSISMSAGLDKARLYASLSYFNDPGWAKTDKVDRFTANVNASADINDYVTLNLLANASMRSQKAPGTLSRTVDVERGAVTRGFDINPFSYALNSSRALRPYDENGNLEYYTMNYAPFNILNELQNNQVDVEVLDSRFQAEVEIKPVRAFNVKVLGSVRYVKSSQEHQVNEHSNMAESYRADYNAMVRTANGNLYRDPDNITAVPVSVLEKGGFYIRTDNKLLNYYFRGLANYNELLKDYHNVNVLGGIEIKSTERSTSEHYGYGMQFDRGNVPFGNYLMYKKLIERGQSYYSLKNTLDRHVAIFGTVGYSYDERYTINGTVRYDGSNKLGKSSTSRWLPTWNVSGAWHMHNEWFLRDSEFVSQMNIRATYGLTANMGPVTNAAVVYRNDVLYRPSAYRENGIYISELENSDITWEKQYELNLGIDFGILNNRISLSVDAYKRDGFDLIGRMRSTGIGGKAFKYANYADMKSHGFEFTLNTKNIKTKDFTWDTNITFSYNKNEITNLYTNPRVIDLLPVEGYPRLNRPVRGLYSIPFVGLNNEGMPIVINEDGVETIGEVNFEEVEKTDFLKYEGPVDPNYIGGLDNSFRFKDFKFGFFFTYQFGSKIRLYPAFNAQYSDLIGMVREFADRWMIPGDEHITNVPAIATIRDAEKYPYLYRAYNAYNNSDARVVKGDFIRLKDVYVTYNVPSKYMKQIGLSSASLRFAVSNVWLLYSDKKLKGQDPEFVRSGGVALPVPRQFNLTLKIGF